jgi:signal transduction histidine kinase
MKDREFYDRLVERLDQLDTSSVQGHMLKLAHDKGVLETIFQSLREGVLIINRSLHVKYLNAAASELLGMPPDMSSREDQSIDRYLRDLDWTRLLDQDPEEWARVSRQEIEVFYPSHRFLQFYMLPYAAEYADDDGAMVIILHDVTELRENTDATIASERINAVMMLAGAVAHEIGNPLNSLTIHLQLLERYFRKNSALPDADGASSMVDVALQEVRRLDTIITQFLKALRPAALDLHPVSVTEIINSSLDFIKHEVEDRGVFVEAVFPDVVPDILGDETQLKQAFYNLIINAVQAMPDGGLIRISIELTDDTESVVIADTGKGIEPENLANIFTPYFTTREEGTGLGLMVVERIVRDHGATLGVDSKVGEGTAFTITFPRYERRVRLLADSDDDLVEATAAD